MITVNTYNFYIKLLLILTFSVPHFHITIDFHVDNLTNLDLFTLPHIHYIICLFGNKNARTGLILHFSYIFQKDILNIRTVNAGKFRVCGISHVWFYNYFDLASEFSVSQYTIFLDVSHHDKKIVLNVVYVNFFNKNDQTVGRLVH